MNSLASNGHFTQLLCEKALYGESHAAYCLKYFFHLWFSASKPKINLYRKGNFSERKIERWCSMLLFPNTALLSRLPQMKKWRLRKGNTKENHRFCHRKKIYINKR